MSIVQACQTQAGQYYSTRTDLKFIRYLAPKKHPYKTETQVVNPQKKAPIHHEKR